MTNDDILSDMRVHIDQLHDLIGMFSNRQNAESDNGNEQHINETRMALSNLESRIESLVP